MEGIDPYTLADIPPAPDGDLDLSLPCRTGRTGAVARAHPVTIHSDWSVTTPHDLPLERIALALGGYVSCIDVVDRLVPAVRELVQRQARRRAPSMARDDGGRWQLARLPAGCVCTTFGFPCAADAAEHARSAAHLGREFGVAPRALGEIAENVYEAYDTRFVQPPDEPGEAAHAVRERRGIEHLWDAGLHPAMIRTIHRTAWPDGPALPEWFYLGALSRRPDLDWIAATLRSVPDEDIAVWLCWTDAELDRVHPAARTGWLQAGVPRRAIAALAGGAYTPIDVAELAHATGRSIAAAAVTLAAWHRANTHPSPAQVALLDQLGVDRWYEPSVGALDWLCRRSPTTTGPSRTELALMLAVCGTRAGAVKALAAGARDPVTAARVMGIEVPAALRADSTDTTDTTDRELAST